ncbi:MAG: hypothetical protein HC769_19850 [Cyanobacteria bacterium CRU_2_1]|nr:hypothetical protein [Cyanobacteria bacterium CRU_2_1]
MPSYYDRLHPWCIVCCLPNAQTVVVDRFRRRSDAEAHLRVLRQINPDAIYEVIFDSAHPSGNEL